MKFKISSNETRTYIFNNNESSNKLKRIHATTIMKMYNIQRDKIQLLHPNGDSTESKSISRIYHVFQTLNKKLIATRRRETPAKRHLRSHRPNPTNLIRLSPDSFHAVNRTRSFRPAGSTPAHDRTPYNGQEIFDAFYLDIFTDRSHFGPTGTEIAFIFSYRKIAAGLKVDPFTSLVTRNAFPSLPFLPLLLLLFRGALFPRKDESRPKPFAVARFGKLYATSGALSHHALQAQSAISCVHRTYAHRHTRGCTRGKLFLARGIRGLVAFVSSCVVARAATRLMIVSPLENYHCGSFVDLLWISGNIGFICFFFFWKKNYSLDRNVSLWRRVIVERKREREFLIEFGFFLNEVDDRKYIIFCEILKTLNNLHSNEKFFTLFP